MAETRKFGAFGSRLQFEASGFVYGGQRFAYDRVRGLEFKHTSFVNHHKTERVTLYDSYLRVIFADGSKVNIRPEYGWRKRVRTTDKVVHDSMIAAADWLGAYTFDARMDAYETDFKARGYVRWGKHQITLDGDLFYRNAYCMSLRDEDVRCMLYSFHMACLKRPKSWWMRALSLLVKRSEVLDLRRDRDCFLYLMRQHLTLNWPSETLRLYRGVAADGSTPEEPKAQAKPNLGPQQVPPRQEAPRPGQPREQPQQEQAPPPPPPPPPKPKIMPSNVQHLATLGLGTDVGWEVVRTRYRQLARKHHPDLLRGKGAKEATIIQAEETLKAINEAYGWLEDFYKLKPR